MYYGSMVLHSKKVGKKKNVARYDLNRNRIGESDLTGVGSSTNSSYRAHTTFFTFSSGVYNYHANASQQFNVTNRNRVPSDAELSLEAAFWVALIFMVFLCIVITVYCIMIQKEEKRGYRDQFTIGNTYLGNDLVQKYSSHSTVVPKTYCKTNDSDFSLQKSSLNALSTTCTTGDDDGENTTMIRRGFVRNSYKIKTFDAPNPKHGIENEPHMIPRRSVQRILINAELKKENHFKRIDINPNSNSKLFAWQSLPKSRQNQSIYSSDKGRHMQFFDLHKSIYKNRKIETV